MNQQIVNKEIKDHFTNLIKKNDFENCLIVSSKGNFKRNYQKLFVDGLSNKLSNIFFFEINEYPNFENINNLYDEFYSKNINLIISIGGGSAIDISKIFSSCEIIKKLDGLESLKIRKNQIFHISVPTTAGSGAESTKFSTIWSKSESEKYSFEDNCLLPNIAYLDSSYTLSLSLLNTLTTSLDALCHCLDCLWNKTKNINAEKNAVNSIYYISEYLPQVINNLRDSTAREFLLDASNKAGQAINITRTSLNHSISYPLTNLYDLPHGFACAFSIPGIIEVYKNQLVKTKQKDLYEKANRLILDLKLKDIYEKYLENLDSEKVTTSILKNSRFKNFEYEIDEKILKNILSISKKVFLG